MRAIEIVLTAIYGWTLVYAEVCSPGKCIKGTSPSSLLVHNKQSGKYLTPGTYLGGTVLSPSDVSSPSSPLNQSTIHVGNNVVVSPPPFPVVFNDKDYVNNLEYEPGMGTGKAAYFPSGWYGLLEPGKAVWGGIPDSSQIKGIGSTLQSVALSTCNPPCASGGICELDGFKAVCRCKEGWTGGACEVCAKGFFGSECKACSKDCSVCDEGSGGTGLCLGTATTPLKKCNCVHGSCTDSEDCACAAGYRTNTTSTGPKCADCAQGFFKDANENCLACPLGCGSCSLREGTTDTPTCTSCLASLSMSTTDPATCVSSGTCSNGEYFDATSAACRSCSPACSTCTGPSTSECLSCATPRVNLAGNCVGFDASTGVCGSALSGLQGGFVVNNAKSKCESCPAGCLSCTIPGFSSASAYSSATCRACQDGYLLENGRCVKTCSEGWYSPPGAASNGTCQQCDSTCVDCIGDSKTCTKCSPPSFALGGSCVNLCPSSSVASNGTCLACSPDCATCSSPSASSCLSCPSTRPVLKDGRCIEFCPKDQYFDGSSSLCKKCDTSCGSCLGGGSTECATCPAGSVLKNGQCVPESCKNGLVTGLGLCLEDLVGSKRETKYLGLLSLFALFGLAALGIWLYVRRQRRHTREAIQDFAEAMDDKDVRDRMMILRLEKVLGLDRVRPQKDAPRLMEEGEKKEKERKRLRELLLISRRKRQRGEEKSRTVEEDIPMTERMPTIDDATAAGASKGKWEEAAGGRQSHWFAPPPPYASTAEGSSSTSIIATSALRSERSVNFADREGSYPTFQTKIVSMSSPTSPDFQPRALRPPPRRTDSAGGGSVGSMHRVPVGQGEKDGKEVDRRKSLKRLWPAMPSPVFGQRQGEGWI